MAFSQIQGKMQIMRILIANDDGIYAAGIKAIAAEFSKKHQVMVVAPDHERSGASHSINLTSPLRIHKTELSGFDNIEAYRVNGTPVDCVIIGCNALNFKPDAIITGVNHGYNLGMDIHYSGTVSAAKEGALMGIPSMAVSMCNLTSKDFSVPARVAAELFDGFIASGSLLYNVNVPDLAYGELKGIKFTGLSKRTYYSPFEKRVDPRGCEYYWWPMRTEYDGDMKADNDERWTAEGFVSVTPILTDFTDYAALKRLNIRNRLRRGRYQHGKRGFAHTDKPALQFFQQGAEAACQLHNRQLRQGGVHYRIEDGPHCRRKRIYGCPLCICFGL